jgi:Na+-translocating ferredoxin:NAD+ oxidoreductase RNF subunit RnfB
METGTKQKIKEIYQALPHQDCGFCGFNSCGQFARAVAEGRASPFGCKQNPQVGYIIKEIMGDRAPAPTASLAGLRQEIGRLSQDVADILARIERLKASGQG